MKLKMALRALALDWLADRDDRYYWRQPTDTFAPAQGARLCLWQPDGKLGDSVIHTQFIASLRRSRPDIRVLVVCAPGLTALWQGIPGVHEVVGATTPRQAARSVQAGGRAVDVFISMEAFLSLDTIAFMRRVRPKVAIGLNVGRYRAFAYSIADHTFDHPRRHVTDRLRALCALLRIHHHDGCDLGEVARSGLTPRVTLAAHVPHVLINTYGAGPQKTFSSEVVDWLTQEARRAWPQAHIVFNVPADQRHAFGQRHGLAGQPALALGPAEMNLWELIALLDQCEAVLTPDTGIAHLAAALNKPLAVFFEDQHYTPVVWRPHTASLYAVLPSVSGDVNHFDRAQAAHQLRAMACHMDAPASSFA